MVYQLRSWVEVDSSERSKKLGKPRFFNPPRPFISAPQLELQVEERSNKGETTMSRAAKLTLAGASTFAVSTIIFVHFQQRAEKAVCPPSASSLLPPLPLPPPFSIFPLFPPKTSELVGKGALGGPR